MSSSSIKKGTNKLDIISNWVNGKGFETALQWLLENGSASVRYLALTELKGQSKAKAYVKSIKKTILRDHIITSLLASLNSDGFWTASSKGKLPFAKDICDRVITVYLSSILAENSLDTSDSPQIKELTDFILSTQHPSGAFVNLGKRKEKLPIAVTALAIFSLIRFGTSQSDSAIQNAYGWLLNQQQKDGSFLGVRGKKCFLATNSVLMAAAEIPKIASLPAIQKSAKFLADNLFQKNEEIPISWTNYRYPQLHYDLIKTLPVLANSGITLEHPQIEHAVEYIFKQLTPQGVWSQQSTSLGLMALFMEDQLKTTLVPNKNKLSDMLTFKILKAFNALFEKK